MHCGQQTRAVTFRKGKADIGGQWPSTCPEGRMRSGHSLEEQFRPCIDPEPMPDSPCEGLMGRLDLDKNGRERQAC